MVMDYLTLSQALKAMRRSCGLRYARARSLWRRALRLAQAQVGPETGGHLNAAPRTNDSTRIARNR